MANNDYYSLQTVQGGTIIQSVYNPIVASSSTAITTQGTYYEVTVLATSITPLKSTSKIMIRGLITGFGSSNTGEYSIQVWRGASAINTPATAGSRLVGTLSYFTSSGSNEDYTKQLLTIDTPGTTSSTAYHIYVSGPSSSTFYLNQTATDSNTTSFWRAASQITLLEIE